LPNRWVFVMSALLAEFRCMYIVVSNFRDILFWKPFIRWSQTLPGLPAAMPALFHLSCPLVLHQTLRTSSSFSVRLMILGLI
jgi:hypothetical protein